MDGWWVSSPQPRPSPPPAVHPRPHAGGSGAPAPRIQPRRGSLAAVTSPQQGHARGTELSANVPCSSYSPSSICFPRTAVGDGSTKWSSTTELRYSSCGSCLAWTVFLHVLVLKKMCPLIKISSLISFSSFFAHYVL